jgi:hypothetical protein
MGSSFIQRLCKKKGVFTYEKLNKVLDNVGGLLYALEKKTINCPKN